MKSVAYSLALLSLALAPLGCGSDDLVLPSEGAATALEVVDGEDQQGIVGEELSEPLVVRLVDARGRPVVGSEVSFSVAGDVGGAELADEVVATDDEGLAATRLTLGTVAGTQRVVASTAGDLEATIDVTALADAPTELQMVAGQDQAARAGSELPNPLVVRVVDRFGNPVPGVTIEWSSTGGGVLSATSAVTDAEGTATIRRTLGSSAGNQTVRASLSGGSAVTFRHTALAGSARALAMVSGDQQSAPVGTRVSTAPTVRLTDADGNAISGVSVTWVVGQGGGSVTPTSSTTDAQGRASTQWTLGSQAGTQTLSAVVSGLNVVTFTATATAVGGGDDDDDDDGGSGSGGAPQARNDAYSTLEDRNLQVSASQGVLANDSDPDGDRLSAEIVERTEHGEIDLKSDGSFTYRPDDNFDGSDSFIYRATDGDTQSLPATVIITVSRVNDPPRFKLGAKEIEISAKAGPQTLAGWVTEVYDGPFTFIDVVDFIVTTDRPDLFAAGPTITQDPSLKTATLRFTPSGKDGTAKVTVVAKDRQGTLDGGDDTSNPQTFEIEFK